MQRRLPLDPNPTVCSDGSIDAVVHSVRYVDPYRILQLAVPSAPFQGSIIGRYIMARCSPCSGPERTDWSIYLRRPLFMIAARPEINGSGVASVSVLLPSTADRGYRFLGDLSPGDIVNVLGPYGRSGESPDFARHLVLVVTSANAPLLLPAAEEMLDRGGRVSVVMRDSHVNKGLLALFPLAIEIHAVQEDDRWHSLLADAITWADSAIIADSSMSAQMWADKIREWRMTLDESFAQILMPADLLCSTGACMTCVVPRTNGSLTRACIRGPIFPLTSLVD